jgi:hypothetical protein
MILDGRPLQVEHLEANWKGMVDQLSGETSQSELTDDEGDGS